MRRKTIKRERLTAPFFYFWPMNLSIFFQPVDPELYQNITAHNSFFRAIAAYTESFPDYEAADIALVGIIENRGTLENIGVNEAADAVRQKLYALKKGSGAYKIVDLGNLVNGHSLEETYTRVREVCSMLMAHNTFPVLVGGSHDIDYGQYLAYENLDRLVNLLSVDAYIDIQTQAEWTAEEDRSRNHLHHILTHDKNYLLNYSHVAYQSYLVDRQAPGLLERFYFDTYRLGAAQQDMSVLEPVARNADMLSFDISAIKSGDAPGNGHAPAFGLTAQEACQICWYAGHSEQLSSAGFFEYSPPEDDARRTTASVVATMIWYLIEGFYHRTYEDDFEGHDFVKYRVPMTSMPEQITFYKAKRSEKWWMEVPTSHASEAKELGSFRAQAELLNTHRSIVPCDPSDYHRAVQGELPDRWIQTHAKSL